MPSTPPRFRRQTNGSVAKRARTGYRRPTRTNPRFKIPRSVTGYRTGFPKQLTMTHKYHSTYVLTSPGGGANAGVVQFRANGMFDPDFQIGGHQPSYFDTSASIYDHFRVVSSTIRVEFTTKTFPDQDDNPWVVGVYIDDDGTPASLVLDTLCEQPSSTQALLEHGSRKTTITKKWNAKSAFGPGFMGQDSLKGNAAADPTEQQVYTIFGRPVDTGLLTEVIYINVTIAYTAVWTELRDMVAS